MATGADSGALVTSQKENLHRQETADRFSEGVQSGHLPVFEAFVELGLTGRDIAEITDVTPPTVSKWRSCKARIPQDRLVFLTLILAHLLDDAEAINTLESGHSLEAGPGAWFGAKDARLNSARAYFALQDVMNKDLPVVDIRNGAKEFRRWWSSDAPKRLQEKRFQLALNTGAGRELEMLKARVKRS